MKAFSDNMQDLVPNIIKIFVLQAKKIKENDLAECIMYRNTKGRNLA
jgi:hypothetical protein